ncbi:MAG: MBOAT family protein [Kiritimatiellae bacterium]|nr:MBOAT family protein [Kiritimatiellia bacterium]
MVFASPFFLTVFLPAVLLAAWGLGAAGKALAGRRGVAFSWGPVNALLLAASLLFYFWGEGWGVLWLVASVLFNAFCAKLAAPREGRGERFRRGAVAAAVAGNLAFLGWFKYAAFAARSLDLLPGVHIPVPEVALPLGISFYTFQAMSYVVDVGRGTVPPAARLADFACYVAFFPQLVAGPIVRYADIAERLRERSVDLARVSSGFKRFLCGLAKKALVANVVAEAADAVWAVLDGGSAVHPLAAWGGLLAYALQIYYDFSGYSDMAIGMGRMLGFDFKENFLHPYAAVSVRDFWRRWHISLSTWFRDYLYIPLGGNRRGLARTVFNGLAVFALCGLWHGAGAMFLLWGLWHGAFLTLERLLGARGIFQPLEKSFPIIGKNGGNFPMIGKKVSNGWKTSALRLPGHFYALAVAFAGWILFRSDSPAVAWRMVESLAGCGDVAREARGLWMAFPPKILWGLAVGAACSLPLGPALRNLLRRCLARVPAVAEAAEWAWCTLLGLAAMLFLAGGSYNPFIYFRF